jgi:hypothetical protein
MAKQTPFDVAHFSYVDRELLLCRVCHAPPLAQLGLEGWRAPAATLRGITHNSAIVLSSRSADSATLALNSELNRRRVRRPDDFDRWLEANHRGEPYVILDDELSGTGLRPSEHDRCGRLVLCKEQVGLHQGHLPIIRAALSRPSK